MGSALRICHFAASRGLGRGEIYVDLANAMAGAGKHIEVGLLVPAHARFTPRIAPGVQLLEYHAHNSRYNPLLWLEIAGLLRKFSPHIVHTHFAKATAIYRMVNVMLRKPFIATKHNPRKGSVFEKVPNVIAVSETVRQSVRSGHAVTIYNGLLPEAQPQRTRPEDDRLQLLSVGRLDPIKGYDRLIQVLATIDLHWELTLLGDGAQRSALEKVADETGTSQRVHLPGFRTDIAQQMANCDACIFSSHSEGFGMALLEAMHYAPLVISTRTGLAGELFPEWLLWDLDKPESLAEMLRDYPARVAKFRNWVAPILPDFSMDRAVDRHLEQYSRVIAAGNQTGT